MNNSIEPQLRPVAINDLRPTQMTVGMREVDRKRTDWRKRVLKDGSDFLGQHMIPVVTGPNKSFWIIDHHHLARALHEEKVAHILVTVVADLGHLPKNLFLTFLDNRNWLHPYDADGKRQSWKDLPKRISALQDDPYRSLAGEVRRAGGFAKTATPYSEFLWADYFRSRISAKSIKSRFEHAVAKAIDLAQVHDANYLPGFAGPEDARATKDDSD